MNTYLVETMAPHYSSQKLLEELSEHNDFFDMIVDMIPSKLYISGQSGDDYNPKKNRFYRGVTEDSKEARKAAAKLAKRRKLDPSQVESTVDKKERLEKDKQSANAATPSSATPGKSLAAPKSHPPAATATTVSTTTSPYQSRIEALRAKLHAKIAEKQAQRPNPDQVSKRAARRAEKRRRQEEAKRKKGGSSSSSSKVDALKTAAAEHYKMTAATSHTMVDPSQDLMHLDFGRLSGLNHKTSENYAETNKSLANLSKSKNLKKMLEDAEEKRKKLQELKKGSEEEKAKATAIQWADTLKEADGQRVKDDPAKLKKALKHKAAKKAKSQKAWKSRMEQTAAAKDEKQKIRQHNLAARKQGGAVGANLSKKKIVSQDNKKDGSDGGRRLSRAGFEGRREFLNSPKTPRIQQ